MRTFVLYLMVTLLTFGLVINEASAKRFGGGRSFGVQRSQSSFSSPSFASQNKSFGQKASTRSKWASALGGLLVGGLLASLFMGHGLGAGLLSWLVIGVLAFFLIGFFRKKMQPGSAAYGNGFQTNNANQSANFFSANNENNENNEANYPADFDQDTFLREAKVAFIRLQAAYDQKNRQDLSHFTAPEVFAEIEMQLNERGDDVNRTEVINLNAQLLDVAEQADSLMASVRFTGLMKENNDSVALDEIWHFRRFVGTQNWVVGGIQQYTN
jgi:predicted lipid-binding transport protein (Tim44 family)